MISDYQILTAYSSKEMSEKVKKYLDKGWQPLNGPFKYAEKDDNGVAMLVIAQGIVKTSSEQLKGIKRLLVLLDGYIAKQNPNALLTDGSGLMTWEELRQHIQFALELPILKDTIAVPSPQTSQSS